MIKINDQECILISEYKLWAKQLPIFKTLSEYWVTNYTGNTTDELVIYLKTLKAYLIPLSKTVKLRQKHFEIFIEEKRYEDAGHKYWRQSMNEILLDAQDKYKYWNDYHTLVIQKTDITNIQKHVFTFIPEIGIINVSLSGFTYNDDTLEEDSQDEHDRSSVTKDGNKDEQMIVNYPPKLSASERKRRKRLRNKYNKKNRLLEQNIFNWIETFDKVDTFSIAKKSIEPFQYMLKKIGEGTHIKILTNPMILFWDCTDIKFTNIQDEQKLDNRYGIVIFKQMTISDIADEMTISDIADEMMKQIIANYQDLNMHETYEDNSTSSIIIDINKNKGMNANGAFSLLVEILCKNLGFLKLMQYKMNDYFKNCSDLLDSNLLDNIQLKRFVKHTTSNLNIFSIIFGHNIPDIILYVMTGILYQEGTYLNCKRDLLPIGIYESIWIYEFCMNRITNIGRLILKFSESNILINLSAHEIKSLHKLFEFKVSGYLRIVSELTQNLNQYIFSNHQFRCDKWYPKTYNINHVINLARTTGIYKTYINYPIKICERLKSCIVMIKYTFDIYQLKDDKGMVPINIVPNFKY